MLSRLPIIARFHWQPAHGLWLFIFVLTAVLQATGMVPAWRFDRTLISQGDFWLLFSGDFVHLNWVHWALDMAGLGIVAIFFSAYASLRQWLWVLFCASLFSGLGMYFRDPQLQTYVGISGVLHGLFIFGALHEIRRYPASGYVLLALLIAKLIWEATQGPMPGSEELIRGKVATDAHLYGAIGGGFAAATLYARSLFDHLVKVKNR
jgi:rhomboid family GlyGly-CTERM serine protease